MDQDNIRILVGKRKKYKYLEKYKTVGSSHLKKPVASPVKCGKDSRVNVAAINALKLFFFLSVKISK